MEKIKYPASAEIDKKDPSKITLVYMEKKINEIVDWINEQEKNKSN
jgi:hypothetical protein